ncbi:unnamed protein product, partial [Musa textilis]
AHHGHPHPRLPAAHRYQRDHVLRTRALQDHRFRRQCFAHVRRDYRAGQCVLYACVRLHRRQARAKKAVLAGRVSNDPLPDYSRNLNRNQTRHQRRG